MNEEEKNANNQNEVVSSEISALDVAKYLIGLAQRDGNPITNLRLQKLLYYAWGCYYRKCKQILFKENIEAWPLGPVIREVYIEYCDNEDRDIRIGDEVFTNASNILTDDVKDFLQEFYYAYKNYRTSALIETSHQEAPWKKTFKKNGKNIISIELLKNFFENLS